MFIKAKKAFGSSIAKDAIVLVSQPFTYKWNERKLAAAENFLKNIKKKGAFAAIAYYEPDKEDELSRRFMRQADYLFQLSDILEHGPDAANLKAEPIKYRDIFKKIAEILEQLSKNTKKKTIILMGGYDRLCLRNYTKHLFFDRQQPTPFETFIILPSLVVSYLEEKGLFKQTKDEIAGEWAKGAEAQRIVPTENVLILRNYKRLL